MLRNSDDISSSSSSDPARNTDGLLHTIYPSFSLLPPIQAPNIAHEYIIPPQTVPSSADPTQINPPPREPSPAPPFHLLSMYHNGTDIPQPVAALQQQQQQQPATPTSSFATNNQISPMLSGKSFAMSDRRGPLLSDDKHVTGGNSMIGWCVSSRNDARVLSCAVATVIRNKSVSHSVAALHRDQLSKPDILDVRPSSIPDGGLGVWTVEDIARGTQFGPYVGEVKTVASPVSHDGYQWLIYKDGGKPSHYIDGSDSTKSNWMRYVNCAPHEHKQNLIAIQHNKQIYFVSCKDILKGTELLVWYGEQFARKFCLSLTSESAHPTLFGGSSSVGEISAPCIIQQIDQDYHRFGESLQCKHCISYRVACSLKIYRHLLTKHQVRRTDLKYCDCEYCLEYRNRTGEISHSKSPSNNDNMVAMETASRYDNSEEEGGANRCRNQQFKKYTCDSCGKCFKFMASLKIHTRSHTGEKPFTCSYCSKSFRVKQHLNMHIVTHTKDKNFKCQFCEKKFTQPGSLKIHVRLHTGETPYRCTECHKGFRSKQSWRIHLVTHTNTRSFQCQYCTKAYTQASSLAIHVRSHTGSRPYCCTVCSKCFMSKYNLDQHMVTHTKIRKYQCDFCDKRFTQRGTLAGHVRIHTGEKPFYCSYCDMNFRQKSYLDKHIKTHV